MIRTRVQSVVPIAEGVRLVELVAAAGGPLPGFRAGDHVDLELDPRIVRSYSVVDAPEAAPYRYRVAVALAADGRGGSRLVHGLHEGALLTIGAPVSGFALVEDAGHTVLIAGGIGITPLMSMVRRLVALDASWELHYAVRSRRAAAFLPQLDALARHRDRVQLHVSEEAGPRTMSVRRIVDRAPAGAHFYCCGPATLLDDFLAATARLDPDRVHFERFHGGGPVAKHGGLIVELALSGGAVEVPDGGTILEALLDVGVDVHFSCMEGICGSCRVKVLDGTPEHHDSVLTPAERAAGDMMMVCTSGSKGNRLVLDL